MSIISLLAIEFYKLGASLRDIAWLLEISKPRVWFIVNKYAPEIMRNPGSNRILETMRPKDGVNE